MNNPSRSEVYGGLIASIMLALFPVILLKNTLVSLVADQKEFFDFNVRYYVLFLAVTALFYFTTRIYEWYWRKMIKRELFASNFGSSSFFGINTRLPAKFILAVAWSSTLIAALGYVERIDRIVGYTGDTKIDLIYICVPTAIGCTAEGYMRLVKGSDQHAVVFGLAAIFIVLTFRMVIMLT